MNKSVSNDLPISILELSVSEGRPSSQEPLPTEAHFFAAILILREFMHHLHFNQLDIEM